MQQIVKWGEIVCVECVFMKKKIIIERNLIISNVKQCEMNDREVGFVASFKQ